MPSRIQFVPVVLAIALGLLGCTASRPVRTSGAANDGESSAGEVDYSSSSVKARTESLAHYSAAVLHEQNDELELAADEYFRAAMADPANEMLVLEATTRLLRFRPISKDDEKPAKMREKALELLKKATSLPEAGGTLFARLGLVYTELDKKHRRHLRVAALTSGTKV